MLQARLNFSILKSIKIFIFIYTPVRWQTEKDDANPTSQVCCSQAAGQT